MGFLQKADQIVRDANGLVDLIMKSVSALFTYFLFERGKEKDEQPTKNETAIPVTHQ